MLNVESINKSQLAGLTIRVETPDGTLFVTISEDESGKPVAIWLHMGKTGAAVTAWAQAMSRMMTLALDKGATVNDIASELSNHTSDKSRTQKNGIVVRSGIEGVFYALMQYKRDKYDQLVETLGDLNERGRGPRLGR